VAIQFGMWRWVRSGSTSGSVISGNGRSARFAEEHQAVAKPVEVSRTEHSPAGLRQIASGTRDSTVVRRLQAIAMVLEGFSREAAARLNGMQRQTLRD
jgi:hypothetical protein